MKKSSVVLFALALSGGQAMAECTAPEPPVLPDGASANLEEMIAGQSAVKAYQTANMEYMQCLEAEFTAAEAASQEGSEEEKASALEAHKQALDAYNDAVSEEEDVAGRFNTEIREFKAANPS